MSMSQHLFLWLGAVPALLSGILMLGSGQTIGGIANLVIGAIMLVVARIPATEK